MLILKTASATLKEARLSERLRQFLGCSYQILKERPHFLRNLRERTANNGMIGSNLSGFYNSRKAEYDSLPKSKEEAASHGARNFDGLQVSVCGFNSLHKIELAPVRYSVLSAYQSYRKDLIGKEDFSGLAALEKENPYILGISMPANLPEFY